MNSVNIVCCPACGWQAALRSLVVGGVGGCRNCAQATNSSLGRGVGGCSEEVTSLPPGSLHHHELCEYYMSHWIWMVGSVEVTPREVVGREVGGQKLCSLATNSSGWRGGMQ